MRIRHWRAAIGTGLALIGALTFLLPPALAQSPASQLIAVAWSPDGDLIAGCGTEGLLRVWAVSDTGVGEVVQDFAGLTEAVYTVAWDPMGGPDDARLASGHESGLIAIWDVNSGEQIATLAGHEDLVTSVAWTPDGERLASAGPYETQGVRVWDVSSADSLATLETQVAVVVAWDPAGSPGNERLAVASANAQVVVWDVALAGMEPSLVLSGDDSPLVSVAWSPDGTRLAGGEGSDFHHSRVYIWDTATGERLAVLDEHTDWVDALAWSPDGTLLASASSDGTVRVWDAATGDVVATFPKNDDFVLGIAWSPDGDRLAYPDSDGVPVIVEVPEQAAE